MKKLFIALAIASFAASTVQIASYAEEVNSPPSGPAPIFGHFPGPPMHEHKKPGGDLKNVLNLTADQEKKAKALREKSRKKMKPIVDQMKSEREKLHSLKEANAKPEEIKAEKEKMKALREKARKIHEENLAGFENILTTEQKTKFEAFKKQQQETMKARKGQIKKHKEGNRPPFPDKPTEVK